MRTGVHRVSYLYAFLLAPSPRSPLPSPEGASRVVQAKWHCPPTTNPAVSSVMDKTNEGESLSRASESSHADSSDPSTSTTTPTTTVTPIPTPTPTPPTVTGARTTTPPPAEQQGQECLPIGVSDAIPSASATAAAAAAVAAEVAEAVAEATASPQVSSPARTAAAVGLGRQTPPSAEAEGGEDSGGGGGGGGGRDGHGRGDAEDGTCRTSSAYILLQLRDLGRKPSSPNAAMSKETFAAPAATATASVAAATSPGMTAQQRFASANGGPHHHQVQQRQHEQQQLIQRQQQQHQQRLQHHHHNQQIRDERAGGLPPGGVNGGSGGGDGGVPYGMSPTNAPATPGYGMTAALERGMYVAGLLPGFQGGTSPPAAVAPSQGSLLQQHPSQMPRGAVLPPGMGSSAALRPICPKRSPETVMVISPTTGQLVPVSACV